MSVFNYETFDVGLQMNLNIFLFQKGVHTLFYKARNSSQIGS